MSLQIRIRGLKLVNRFSQPLHGILFSVMGQKLKNDFPTQSTRTLFNSHHVKQYVGGLKSHRALYLILF